MPILITIAMAAGLTACTVGPDYVRPAMTVTPAFKEAPPDGAAWKEARPRQVDASADPWTVFGDATLTDLVGQAVRANQSVAQADANVRSARAAAQLARSAYFPTVGVVASGSRSRVLGNALHPAPIVANSDSLLLEASWEPDLWGSVRRSVESANATTQATLANLAAVRLTVQAEVAQDYLALRISDQLADLLGRSAASYKKALDLSTAQFRAGTVTRTDVALATAQYQSTLAQQTDVAASRAQYEHAIAILLGKTPAEFSLPVARLDATLPAVPIGLPSELLERRPDIAAAERQAAAANAQIGVAQAAFYPLATLSGSGGGVLAPLSQFMNAPGRVWSLGASLAQTVFDGGARRARSDEAVANYDSIVAQYRQTVLNGFQEVEDNLAILRVLADEQGSQDLAVAASRDAERIALSQYRAGTTTYLTVITAQTTALSNERTAVSLRGRRFAASVTLVKALGGGWSASALAQTGGGALIASGCSDALGLSQPTAQPIQPTCR